MNLSKLNQTIKDKVSKLLEDAVAEVDLNIGDFVSDGELIGEVESFGYNDDYDLGVMCKPIFDVIGHGWNIPFEGIVCSFKKGSAKKLGLNYNGQRNATGHF